MIYKARRKLKARRKTINLCKEVEPLSYFNLCSVPNALNPYSHALRRESLHRQRDRTGSAYLLDRKWFVASVHCATDVRSWADMDCSALGSDISSIDMFPGHPI